MSIKVLAIFECVSCKHTFSNTPGPHNECFKCGSLYLNWLNYEQDFNPKKETTDANSKRNNK